MELTLFQSLTHTLKLCKHQSEEIQLALQAAIQFLLNLKQDLMVHSRQMVLEQLKNIVLMGKIAITLMQLLELMDTFKKNHKFIKKQLLNFS